MNEQPVGIINSPAPWRAVRPRSLWRIKDAAGHFVMEGGYCNVRNQQDAFLIAAAPELLQALADARAALIWAHDVLGLQHQDERGAPASDEYADLQVALNKADSAINKALGNGRE